MVTVVVVQNCHKVSGLLVFSLRSGWYFFQYRKGIFGALPSALCLLFRSDAFTSRSPEPACPPQSQPARPAGRASCQLTGTCEPGYVAHLAIGLCVIKSFIQERQSSISVFFWQGQIRLTNYSCFRYKLIFFI